MDRNRQQWVRQRAWVADPHADRDALVASWQEHIQMSLGNLRGTRYVMQAWVELG